MSTPVELIKEKLSIVDVVASYIKLDRSGIYFKACCPFHNEKTPSFFVSPGRNTFHCFGCGKGGDIFTFVEEIEGEDFAGALKLLANRAGVSLDKFPRENNTETTILYDILESATKFYEARLRESTVAIEYLKSRGITGTTAKEFRIGVAPDGWSNLTDYLKGRGWKDVHIERAGLAIPGKRGIYDRFRARIMFPITSSQGRVVGFTGRILPGGDEGSGKYVNTPETALYHKSKVLYGYDKAKGELLREGVAIIVEGQMDLISSHQAGIKNTIAVSGTALTDEHLAMVGRFADKVIFSFDADKAGRAALKKGVMMALTRGMEAKAIVLPNGKDPADLILENSELWTNAVKEARPAIDFFIEKIQEEEKTPEARIREMKETVLPLIAAIPSTLLQAHFVKKMSEVLAVPEDAVRTDLRKIQVPQIPATPNASPPELSSLERIIRLVFGFVSAFREKIDVPRIEHDWQRITGSVLLERMAQVPKEIMEGSIFEAEAQFKGKEKLEESVDDLLYRLELGTLEAKLAITFQNLRRAEEKKDDELSQTLLAELQEISKTLHTITSLNHASSYEKENRQNK